MKTGAVSISTRAQLGITTARVAAAINGTIAGTISGQGSVAIYELAQKRWQKNPRRAEVRVGHGGGDAAASGRRVHIALPFQQVPMNYGSWPPTRR